jgi:hypothetical protein
MDNKEELEDNSMDSVTIADCVFMLLTILPDGNIHYVDVNSDDLAEFLREKKEFKVLEGAIGYVQEVDSDPSISFPTSPKDRRDIN